MTDFGLVCDSWPGGMVAPDELGPLTIVRLTAHYAVQDGNASQPGSVVVQPELVAYAEELRAAHIRIALVYARESFPTGLTRAQRRKLILQYLAAVQPDYFIAGNEMDVDMSLSPKERESSWGMTPERYRPLWEDGLLACAGSTARLVVGGLIGGTEGWLVRFRRLLHGNEAVPMYVDLHLYGDAPGDVVGHITQWQAANPGLTLCVFEWNLPEAVAIQGAGAYRAMVHALNDAGVEAATYFCARDAMVQGLGFYDYPWVVDEVFEGVHEVTGD